MHGRRKPVSADLVQKTRRPAWLPGLATSRITAIAVRAAGPLVLNGSVGARRFDMGTEG
jgi:hypothetical protein